ncbi:MAG: hypothetical protein Q8L52_03080 [bacterium]|nr:hypothetical protein [bacterium]
MDSITLDAMKPAERAFWNEFLPKVFGAIAEVDESACDSPRKLPDELVAEFRTAVTVYGGDKYCQMHQIRGFFDCTAVPVGASIAH